MTIVFVGTFALAPKSTMQARALPLAQALLRRGHAVTLVLPPWDNPAQAGTTSEAEGVKIINLLLPPNVPMVWYGLLGARLFQQVTALKPDIVHAFKPKGFSGLVAQALLAQRALRKAGPRIVVDTDDWEGAGGWNDVEPYPWWQRAFFAYQEQWLMRHADCVTAASRTLATLAAEVRGSDAGVCYLPNGAKEPSTAQVEDNHSGIRAKLGLSGAPVVLLYTRFIEFAPERVVSLLETVAQRGERPTVLLVGKGLRGEETALLKGIEQCAHPLPVVNAGWVAHEELPHYLALADVALFPMDDTLLNRAKCPARLVDLLNAGVPVVAEAVGQCKEYIQDGSSGLLVSSGDSGAFADAVVRLLRDPKLRARMGQDAQQRISAEYRWDHLAALCEGAYRA